MTIYTDNLLKRICFLNQKFSRVDHFLKRHLGETNLICRSTRPTDLILVKTKNNITKFWFLVFYFYHQNIFVFLLHVFSLLFFCFQTQLVITKTKEDLSYVRNSHWRCSLGKKVFLKVFEISQKNTSVGVSF